MYRRTLSLQTRVFVLGGYLTPFTGKGSPYFIDKKHPDYLKKNNPTLEELLSETVKGTLEMCDLSDEKINLVDRLIVGNFTGELFSQQGHLGAAAIGSLNYPSQNRVDLYREVCGMKKKNNNNNNNNDDGKNIIPNGLKYLQYKPSMRVEAACASGGLAISAAVDALTRNNNNNNNNTKGIKMDSSDIVLVLGVEAQNTASARVGADYLARASHYANDRPIDDFTFPCLFARRMESILKKNNFSLKDTALVAQKAFDNASKNPLAHLYTKKKMSLEEIMAGDDITVQELEEEVVDNNNNKIKVKTNKLNIPENLSQRFLSNEQYKPFLRLSDCSQVSDGGAGVILLNEEGLKKLNISINDPRLVEIRSIASSTGSLYSPDHFYNKNNNNNNNNKNNSWIDLTRMDVSGSAARKAFDLANIKINDINVLELHDCFTIAELLLYEAIGLAEYGGAKKLINNGDTLLTGRVPVNTGGGLIGFGHPVGATGVKQVLEIYRQMKGLCGGYQMKTIPKLGATVNMGGEDRTAVAMVLENQ